jgi:predicted deacylase
MIRETHHIAADTAGTSHELTILRFKPEKPLAKIYLQAALHADEQPGMLVLHHLIQLLTEAEKEDRLKAEFVILPMVNPLGMAHLAFGKHRGRYHPLNGLNYNRNWPDLDAMIHKNDADFSSQLTDDVVHNQQVIRQAVKAAIDSQSPKSALDRLRHMVMAEAYDADMVLDLHCADDALNHIYIVPQLMPEYQDLSDWMQSAATMTAEDSGGGSFDEVWPGLWIKCARRYPGAAWPDTMLSATLEYRGENAVDDQINRQDAQNLYHFLMGRGFISGTPAEYPSAGAEATPLTAVEYLRADRPCLVVFQQPLGAVVSTGDVIAELLSLEGDDAFTGKTLLRAGTDGVFFDRSLMKLAWPDHIVAKIAGKTPLVDDGYLLSD